MAFPNILSENTAKSEALFLASKTANLRAYLIAAFLFYLSNLNPSTWIPLIAETWSTIVPIFSPLFPMFLRVTVNVWLAVCPVIIGVPDS